jgi:eukaryotic-like serine/threonine-protein kinase
MTEGITWCPYCGEPHKLGEEKCPKTGFALSQKIHKARGAGPGAATPRREPPRKGLVIGKRYEVIRSIGRGGMGEVLEAKDLVLKRLVAVKVVASASTRAAKRLEREGRLIAALSHPNICAVYDVGMLDGDIPYLVLERLEGKTLATAMKTKRKSSISMVVEVFSKVLSALQCAHTHGVVHRDLKPANVFLARQGTGAAFEVKLLDFGLAKNIFDQEQSAFTKPGHTVGTPAYMSPEQLSGKPVDGRSDLFSVGMMIFEMLTGDHPFPGSTRAELAMNIVHGTPRDLQMLRRTPLRLAKLIGSAMQKDRDLRPPSAQAFRAELLACLEEISDPMLPEAPGSSRPSLLPRLDPSSDSNSGTTLVSAPPGSSGERGP